MPNTVNVGLNVPNTGDLVGTWGSAAVNPDFVAIDGLFAGVTTIGLSGSNVTLTAPAAFTAVPAAGPTQSQNAVLRFTGALLANLTVTLPLPGRYVVENLTTGNFTVQFFGNAGGQRISTAQGSRVLIYNDGVNCYFVNDSGSSPGKMELWAGVTAMPSWVGFCTTSPYLLCDGSIYNIATYPYLGARLGSSFGGNGVTTFGVPDMRGRVPLAYDGTGARITVAACGLNGQVLGAALDQQVVTLTAAQIPAHTHPSFLNDLGHIHPWGPSGFQANTAGTGASGTTPQYGSTSNATGSNNSAPMSITNAANAGGGGAHSNVQPSQVVGLWVIHT